MSEQQCEWATISGKKIKTSWVVNNNTQPPQHPLRGEMWGMLYCLLSTARLGNKMYHFQCILPSKMFALFKWQRKLRWSLPSIILTTSFEYFFGMSNSNNNNKYYDLFSRLFVFKWKLDFPVFFFVGFRRFCLKANFGMFFPAFCAAGSDIEVVCKLKKTKLI